MRNLNYLSKNVKRLMLLTIMLAVGSFAMSQSLPTIMSSFRNYDMNFDGISEINSFSFLPFENYSDEITSGSKLVLVLVENRLFDNIPGSQYTGNELMTRLERFKDDLRAEGYRTRFIRTSVYDGTNHQDGRTLLAIREFLRLVDNSWNLKGVVLVGSFPESMIVRRWIWKNDRKVTIDGIAYNGEGQPKTKFLRILPEVVAHRADIVLADLNGRWEQIYLRNTARIESIEAIPVAGAPSDWPQDNTVFTSTKFNDDRKEFEDFFFIRDDNFQRLSSNAGTLKLRVHNAIRNPEISYEDRNNPNPICMPEIFVSRINTRNVAVIPDPEFRDMNGISLLGANGKPQQFHTPTSINTKNLFIKDPAKERELLISYFDRNHSFRVGGNPLNSHRTSAVNYELQKAPEINNYLGLASSSFGAPLSFTDASLYKYVQFLIAPASLKCINAHSNSQNSHFGNDYNNNSLESITGGYPWRWKKVPSGSNFRYIPS
jgi:hypothetical protein